MSRRRENIRDMQLYSHCEQLVYFFAKYLIANYMQKVFCALCIFYG